jgi:phospholipid/cholesterol/gamma-HCH transport system substrate-binding protein
MTPGWGKISQVARSREIKVGAFVLAGLIVVGVVIFLIGDERRLFASKVEYQAVFDDVEGLRRGSPVRMGGVDIGTVDSVAYGADPKKSDIFVSIIIVEEEAQRIRSDSVATIEGKGLLGDKMIVVTVGSPAKPWIPPGGTIPSGPGSDLTAMVSRLGEISTKVESVVDNLARTTGAFADEEFHNDLKQSVRSLSGILKSIDEGDGYVTRLLKDPAEADKLSRTMSNLERTSAGLGQTTQEVNAIIHRVKTGPGFAHEVIYGQDGQKMLAQVGGAAEEVGTTLRGIREGNGIARSFIYGDDESQQVMKNLNEMSVDLKQIVADVRAGKGTVGALLVDPSVYEDIKVVLGNVQRNKTLRALVRYSIQRDERVRGVEVRDPTPTAPASGGGNGRVGAREPAAEPASSTGATP